MEKNSQRRPSANKNDIDEAMSLEAKILSLEGTKRQLWLQVSSLSPVVDAGTDDGSQGLVYVLCWIGYFIIGVTVAVDPLATSTGASRFTWITLVSL